MFMSLPAIVLFTPVSSEKISRVVAFVLFVSCILTIIIHSSIIYALGQDVVLGIPGRVFNMYLSITSLGFGFPQSVTDRLTSVHAPPPPHACHVWVVCFCSFFCIVSSLSLLSLLLWLLVCLVSLKVHCFRLFLFISSLFVLVVPQVLEFGLVFSFSL